MSIEIVEMGDNELGFTIPQELIDSGRFLPGDRIGYRLKPQSCQVINLSCPVLLLSRFRRNLNGILRNMNNPEHPLRRVLVKHKERLFWCVPHDKSLQPAFLKQPEVDAASNSDDQVMSG